MSDLVIDADVGVVGAGPGGMVAATRLAAAGLSVAVLDEGPRAGGQIYRQPPAGASDSVGSRSRLAMKTSTR